MRGAVVGGSGSGQRRLLLPGAARGLRDWAIPGWSWADVLPHFRAIETDLDFDGPLHGSDGPILVRRVTEFDGCTASFVQAAPKSDSLAGRSQRSVTRGRAHGCRRGAAEHQRRHQDRAGRRLSESRARRAKSDPAGEHTGHGGSASKADARSGWSVRAPAGAVELTADRIVLSAGAIGSAHLLMLSGVGPPRDSSPPVSRSTADVPVGARTAIIPEWVLPVDWTDADLPPVEAVLTTPNGLEIRPYTRGFGAMVAGTDGRSGRPAAHRRGSDAAAFARPDHRGVRRPGGAAAHRAPLRQRARDVATLTRARSWPANWHRRQPKSADAIWSTSQHLCGTAPMGATGTPQRSWIAAAGCGVSRGCGWSTGR